MLANAVSDGAILKGKRALVTGAGKGFGRAISEKLHQAGAEIIAVSRTMSDLDTLKTALGDRLETWVRDVTHKDFVSDLSGLSKLDILVNNAGTNRPGPFVDVTEEDLDLLITLNIRSMFLTAQAATRVMSQFGGGVIVNVSSQMGHIGAPNRVPYCMTKHAVEGMTKAMAVEMAPKGIRVNSFAPTFVETPLTEGMFEDRVFKNSVLDKIPMGRLATLSDVANAVLFLVSPGAEMITGHSLLVDGGWTAQ